MQIQKKKRIIICAWVLGIVLFLQIAVFAAGEQAEEVIQTSAAYLKNSASPAVGSEWTVIALARSGVGLSEEYLDNYFQSAEQYVKERKGILHERKYTEYSRMILALTAIGKNPTGIGGYNLLVPLSDFEKTIRQGANGAVFALLALDSVDYKIPLSEAGNIQATREEYLKTILEAQLSNGGFSFSGEADVDFTAMALQALAPYRQEEKVEDAVQRALQFLSQEQSNMGGFVSMGVENCESTAQVLTALSTLRIPVEDERFTKNGVTVLDNLLTFYREDGSFSHISSDTEGTLMATEQAVCALTAYQRMKNGLPGVYDMTDVIPIWRQEQSQSTVGLTGKNNAVRIRPIVQTGKHFSDLTGHPSERKIIALAEREIVSGISEQEFAPQRSITRAEFSAVMVKGLGLPLLVSTVFQDVSISEWYASYIGSAYSFSVINGVSEKIFEPEFAITREEAAVMLARAARLCGMESEITEAEQWNILSQFTDYRTCSDWAAKDLAFCYREGILPQEDLEVRPHDAALRCEVAEMLYQLLQNARLL